MNYCPIPDLAKKFWTSERTIYTYLNKNGSKIRIKKKNWSSLVHEGDFYEVVSVRLQKFYNLWQGQWNNHEITSSKSVRIPSEELHNTFSKPKVVQNNFRDSSNGSEEILYGDRVLKLEENFSKLQKELDLEKIENEQLRKARDNFENQSKEYAIKLKDEQSEKEKWENKYFALHDDHLKTIETVWSLKVKLARVITALYILLFLSLVVSLGAYLFRTFKF